MTTPTPVVRAVTYERDDHRCVSCGTLATITYQHRAAEGMGGRKARPRLEEGLTACAVCNAAYEGFLQVRALAYGWKVRRFVVEQGLAAQVPVRYALSGWHLLFNDGRRVPIKEGTAVEMMRTVYGPVWDEWRTLA